MMKTNERYMNALRSADTEVLEACLKDGVDVNICNGGHRVFDILLMRHCEKGMKMVLKNPKWNPNYIMSDSLSPLERALVRGREDVALQIMRHPNFKEQARLGNGRTVAMAAVMFSAPAVYQATKRNADPNAKDNAGATLSTYIERYGQPKTGRLVAIRQGQETYRATLQAQNEHQRA